MALKKITEKDFEEALDALTPYGKGSTCWIKELGKTENGTGLYLVIGWTRELGYTQDDIDANGFGGGDSGDCIAYKIGYFNYKPGMRYMLQDFDTFNMPYNLTDDKANGIYMGDVWETDGMLPNSPDSWSIIADGLNKDAQDIWDTWGENGDLDRMAESKNTKGESKMKKCSMQKKKESFAKQNEYRRGELDFRGGFDFNGQQKKSVISKISKALDKAGIPAVVTSGERLEVPFGDDAVYMTAMSQSYGSNKCSYVNVRQKSDRNTDVGVYNVGDAVKVVQEITQGQDAPNESKKHTCSMQKKKESLSAKKSKKQESVFDEIDPSYMLAQTFDEILRHTNDDIVINDSSVAEALGKYAIDDAFRVTDARNEDEFVDEATSILSGSPLDGSTFTASDAEDYARELWNA